jgi:gamma-glutamylcyclotransferase (GGCT)/AIG2-like uncharacterized protein YtfP
LCGGVLEIKEATVLGRLYDLPYGFPALVVPEESVLATGTTDYLADVEKQQHVVLDSGVPSTRWDTVHGELMTFDDPEERLPALDALERYVPGEEGLYERVLVSVEITGEAALAWTYRMARAAGVYLPGGRWSAK